MSEVMMKRFEGDKEIKPVYESEITDGNNVSNLTIYEDGVINLKVTSTEEPQSAKK